MQILIAGAGHGGLAAGAILAKAGHAVTVIEQKRRDALGHDWEDRFTFSVLADALEIAESDLPAEIWRDRGDCTFVSPDGQTHIDIHFDADSRQRVMWRKPLLAMLLDHAEACGVRFLFETQVTEPLVRGLRVTGLRTQAGDLAADLVIDAAGVFSPVRTKLPAAFGIEKSPARGDVFYARRVYYNRLRDVPATDIPFEVYLRHAGEAGLSWFCTNPDSVDVLIGRIDPLTDAQFEAHAAAFRASHPWMGTKIVHGGQSGVIPVRRPLTRMTADGYAAVGDSAFMTTPMNGMGIDLSLRAGKLLAETVLENPGCTAQELWLYNRDFHILYGGEAAKNAGLKNALLRMSADDVSFLFASRVVESGDLAGGGQNLSASALLGKLRRGMKKPPAFTAVIDGIMRGGRAAALYRHPPQCYSTDAIARWDRAIAMLDLPIG
ncbi:MAG: NAD(P)/FAD-dependent oxidoreductase [Clostridia bacterium]|nr:NAD(P)/FAD-dependent oxidoreductase [Clostridia bacterium]